METACESCKGHRDPLLPNETMILRPKGQVLYKKEGPIDPLESSESL
jgi:hypothetical protein